MRKVFIPNRAGHNLKAAEEYGELVVLSAGTQNLTDLQSQHRQFYSLMCNSEPDDYVVVLGPASLVALASAIMATRHGMVNYLIFDKGVYRERNIVYSPIGI